MDQRYVGLEIVGTSAGKLTVKLPPNSKIAPPGAYMLFLVERRRDSLDGTDDQDRLESSSAVRKG